MFLRDKDIILNFIQELRTYTPTETMLVGQKGLCNKVRNTAEYAKKHALPFAELTANSESSGKK